MDFKTRNMEVRKMDISLENILPSLAKALYGEDWRVSIRELLQNAHDALVERKARKAGGDDEPLGIDIIPDPTNGTLTFRDNGIGMTEEEVQAQLATVGAGHKSKQIQQLAQQPEANRCLLDQLIGQYGIGFLSSFIIADKVLVKTKSNANPGAPGVRALFTGETQWYRTEDQAIGPGTEVILQLKERPIVDPQTGRSVSMEELLNFENLKREVKRFGDLLPFPINVYPNPDALRGDLVNSLQGPWERDKAFVSCQVLIQYLRNRHPDENEPLYAFSFRLSRQVDQVDAHGIIYFPRDDGKAQPDESITGVELFCKRMFITNDIAPLLPDWVNFVRVVVECPDLSPTLSRSDVIRYDPPFVALKEGLGKRITEALSQLAEKQKSTFDGLLSEHRERLYLSLMTNYQKTKEEAFFRALINHIPFIVIHRGAPTGQPMTLPDYKRSQSPAGGAGKSRKGSDKSKTRIYYLNLLERTQPVAQMRSMILQRNILVVEVAHPVEAALLKAYGHAFSDHVSVHDVAEILDIYVEQVDEAPYEAMKQYLLSLDGGPDEFKASRFDPTFVPAIMTVSGAQDPETAHTLSQILTQGGSIFDGKVRRAIEEAIEGARCGKRTHMIMFNDANPLVRCLRDHSASGGRIVGAYADVLLDVYHMAEIYADPRLAETASFYSHRNEVLAKLLDNSSQLVKVQAERDSMSLEVKNMAKELQEERARHSAPITMEKRRIAMLLTDLTGSTRMVGFLDQLDSARIIQTYAGEVGKMVVENGGRVEKFTGDGIFAYFEQEDPQKAAVAAARCAVAIKTFSDSYFKAGDAYATCIASCITIDASRTVLHYGDVTYGDVGGVPALVGKNVVLLFRACSRDELFKTYPVIMTFPFYDILHLGGRPLQPAKTKVDLDRSLPAVDFFPHPNWAPPQNG